MVKFGKLEETIDQFKKQIERFSKVTRDCVINIDDDITTLWDKVMGNGVEKIDTNKGADWTEGDGGDQCVSSNDDLVFAPINNTICSPFNQSGQHLDTSPSKSMEKSFVKGDRKVNKTVAKEVLHMSEE